MFINTNKKTNTRALKCHCRCNSSGSCTKNNQPTFSSNPTENNPEVTRSGRQVCLAACVYKGVQPHSLWFEWSWRTLPRWVTFCNRAVLFWSTAAWQDVFQTLSRCLWRNVISHPGAQYLHCSPRVRFIMPDLSAPAIWKGEKGKQGSTSWTFDPSYISELSSKRG